MKHVNQWIFCLLLSSQALFAAQTETASETTNQKATQTVTKSQSSLSNLTYKPGTAIHQSQRDDRLYQLITLKNEMTVLLISDPEATKSLGAIALPVGSLSDPAQQQGLAHYTEHMVLMGSEKYPTPSEFSEFLNQHSGSYNASTAQSRTAYFFEVENSALDEAADRLADALSAPKLDPINADKERNAVNAELTMARANEGHRLGQVDSETINQKHPASQFSGGNLETLSDKADSKLHDALVQFYSTYYSSNIMVGILYSNQSIDALTELAEATFGRIPNHHITPPMLTERALTPETLSKWIVVEPAQAKKLLYLQFPIENNLADFAEKSDTYLSYLINHRSEGTLFDTLQKQGLIESIQANTSPTRYGNSGQFSIYVTLTDKGLMQQETIIANIMSYLALIQQEGIDERYFHEIQNVLNISFNYPDISRDMRYVEHLTDQMLLYPHEHVLDAEYLATQFNPQAISERIQDLTLDNARIWTIAPNQTTDKIAYFVETPYAIRDLSDEEKQRIMTQAAQQTLSLPPLNPFIADDLTLVTAEPETLTEAQTQFSEQGNHRHFQTQFFADEPKAAITLALRTPEASKTITDQVAFALWDYLLMRDIADLRFQAGIAGIDIALQRQQGLQFSVDGFSQHLPEMLLSVLNRYRQLQISEDDLLLAKSYYLQSLDAAEESASYKLAMDSIIALSSDPYFSRADRRATVATITVEDLNRYRQKLFDSAVPYMISLGNLTPEQSQALYDTVKATLNPSQRYAIPAPIQLHQAGKALLSQTTKNTDHALFAGYFPLQSDSVKTRVTNYVLYNIISPWFYDELRSKQQLGYAVFALPTSIQKNYGLAFLIQSNTADPATLLARYEAFFPFALEKLQAMSDDAFDRYKQGVISELQEAPQTLNEEMIRYRADFNDHQWSFDGRQQRIEAVQALTKADVVKLFEQDVVHNSGFMVLSEVIGQQDGAASVDAVDVIHYEQISDLQRDLKNKTLNSKTLNNEALKK